MWNENLLINIFHDSRQKCSPDTFVFYFIQQQENFRLISFSSFSLSNSNKINAEKNGKIKCGKSQNDRECCSKENMSSKENSCFPFHCCSAASLRIVESCLSTVEIRNQFVKNLNKEQQKNERKYFIFFKYRAYFSLLFLLLLYSRKHSVSVKNFHFSFLFSINCLKKTMMMMTMSTRWWRVSKSSRQERNGKL